MRRNWMSPVLLSKNIFTPLSPPVLRSLIGMPYSARIESPISMFRRPMSNPVLRCPTTAPPPYTLASMFCVAASTLSMESSRRRVE
ncbi:MAG: hypothetical protein HY804_01980 [Nitrospinae bacterium]|nr:hypothetical protein [Nitrospinota bacterium]